MRIRHRLNNGAAPRPLLSVRELAEWLRLHPASIYRLARAG
jgi:DNA-binding MurR/RpiR family transcriptional regulator